MNKSDLNELIRSKVEEAGNQKLFALQCGISASFLSDVLKGKREPGQKLLAALGLQREIIYSPISVSAESDNQCYGRKA